MFVYGNVMSERDKERERVEGVKLTRPGRLYYLLDGSGTRNGKKQ